MLAGLSKVSLLMSMHDDLIFAGPYSCQWSQSGDG